MPSSTNIPGALEKIPGRADTPFWQRGYQMLIGFLLVPLFARFRGDLSADWQLFPFFLCVLLAVRIAPIIVRRLVPFAADLQTQWCEQRTLAKRYDSYQWRKLAWYGLGLSGYVAVFGRINGIPAFLALFCVVSGGLGELAWRRVAAARAKREMPEALRPVTLP
jgi:hypothetical protein